MLDDLASLIYPFSPKVAPQLSFTLKKVSVNPTSKPPRVTVVPQLSKIPLEQLRKFLPSTATETGLVANANSNSEHPLMATYPLILKSPEVDLQVPALPT